MNKTILLIKHKVFTRICKQHRSKNTQPLSQ